MIPGPGAQAALRTRLTRARKQAESPDRDASGRAPVKAAQSVQDA
jgi:hypothetical protein